MVAFTHDPTMGSQYAQALMEAATDGVVVIDHRGVIEATNAAAERLFGFSSAELVGHNVSTLMPPGDRERHDDYLRRYLESGVSRIIGHGREVEAQRSDGSRFPAALSVGRISGSDPPRFVGFVRDISDQKRAVADLQSERDRARDREAEAHRSQARMLAVARMATMGEMAAGIAHEINQPLTAISNYARACQRFAAMAPPDFEEIQDCMNEIANETQRAAEIIRELRSIVREQKEVRAPRDLSEVVRQVRPLILADARVHGTRVQFNLSASLPAVVVDAVQIQQLLLNLTRNALEAVDSLPDGEREIQIATTLVSEAEVELTVSDNGVGIDPELEQTMFEPFVTSKPLGTGLGLAISRTIATNSGGQIVARPASPRGACFALILPVQHEVLAT